MTRSLRHIYTRSYSSMAKNEMKEIFWDIRSYKYFLPVQTRWSDNDLFDHVNNSIYNHYFDTVINNFLIWFCRLNDHKKDPRFMVHSECQYRSPVSYPETLLVGLGLRKFGNSTLHYQTALFEPKVDYLRTPELKNGKTQGDPLLQLSIGSQGRLIPNNISREEQEKIIKEIEQFYNSKAAACGYNVHAFTDKNSQPLKRLPSAIIESCQSILINIDNNVTSKL